MKTAKQIPRLRFNQLVKLIAEQRNNHTSLTSLWQATGIRSEEERNILLAYAHKNPWLPASEVLLRCENEQAFIEQFTNESTMEMLDDMDLEDFRRYKSTTL